MEFRTKREAEEAARDHERKADALRLRAIGRCSTAAERLQEDADGHEAEAARIRDLLPSLPD